MTQLNNGPISSNDLMQRLAQAKKVMNKVDNGDFERGHVNEDMLRSDPEEYVHTNNMAPVSSTRNVTAPASADRISQSKLPDAIKKAMMENPIPQISLSESIDMDFLKGAKRLMEQEGVSTKKPQQKQAQPQPQTYSNNLDMNSIAVLIENTVRKVMDEKLNQILTAQQTSSINENLVLKVGDSVFKGKITGVNKAK